MSNLAYRRNTLLINTDSRPAWADSYTVTAYEVGGQVASGSSGQTITLRAGHGFENGDKLIVGTDASTYIDVDQAPTATTIHVSANTTVVAGDILLNLGPDTGASSPSYDGSEITTYSDMDGTTSNTNSQVTADSLGGYGYWYTPGKNIWELVRNTSGAVVEVIRDVADARDSFGTRYANQYATGGAGTSGDPWTGWERVVTSETEIHVHFPSGYYSVVDGVSLSGATNVKLTGEGRNSILERSGSFSGTTLDFTVAVTGATVEGLTFDNSANANNSIDFVNGCADVTVKNCFFIDHSTGEAIQFKVGGTLSSNILIEGNRIESTASSTNIRAIDINDFGKDCRVLRNTIDTTGAISLNPSSTGTTGYRRIEVSGNHIKDVDASNILVRSWDNPASTVGDVIVTNNSFENAGLTLGKGFIVVGENPGSTGSTATYYRTVVTGNTGRGWGDSSGGGIGITVGGDATGVDMDGVVVANNVIDARQPDGTQQNSSYGIYTRENTKNCVISNNVILYPGRSGITLQSTDFCVVSNNIIDHAVQYGTATSPAPGDMGGIHVQSGVTHANIFGNKIYNPGTAAGNTNGIFIRSDATNTDIDVFNNQMIDDQGTPTMTQGLEIGSAALRVRGENNYISGESGTSDGLPNPMSVGGIDTVTVASDAITYTQAFMAVAAESGGVDNLQTINGGVTGDLLMLRGSGTDQVTLNENDNIRLQGGTVLINGSQDLCLLVKSATLWLLVVAAN